ncbi:MAG: hypothetical protein DKM50_09845 [Candidatus Margulisiibacteriota bacterium]|nr:MAG: hypothetical protein A2X43_03935 [Candidatus Margulisbacteria bacterium GWD2_39_127]OGI05153.1 MAG: hypothetical protein A2X42_02445 [Candidatus Margulisbacteria bacterium GWF2_38_17]OGI06202.1 MAG: hypothetical protein A2X41_08025 [Candidatus Margulisbacteria bacterium GWE2_39_32]PZM78857.1 MAG: hypothetical protein DKM50_09845 [Candidatus Margulisiibacteriota bacterium]HAR64564.1 hypothetical protein [Candidatus Margulisiibacteriota bacterium]
MVVIIYYKTIATPKELYPFSFAKKVSVYKEMTQDLFYRKGLLKKLKIDFGDSIITGSYLAMLDWIGKENQSYTMNAFIGLVLLESVSLAITSTIAANNRDNAEMRTRMGTADAQHQMNYCKKLIWSGLIDLGMSATLIAGGLYSFRTGSILSCLLAMGTYKFLDKFNQIYADGLWSSLKFSIGSKQTKQYQLNMKNTVNAIEYGSGELIYGAGSFLVFHALTNIGNSSGLKYPLWFVASGIGGALMFWSKFQIYKLMKDHNEVPTTNIKVLLPEDHAQLPLLPKPANQ